MQRVKIFRKSSLEVCHSTFVLALSIVARTKKLFFFIDYRKYCQRNITSHKHTFIKKLAYRKIPVTLIGFAHL